MIKQVETGFPYLSADNSSDRAVRGERARWGIIADGHDDLIGGVRGKEREKQSEGRRQGLNVNSLRPNNASGNKKDWQPFSSTVVAQKKRAIV